ncbi:MAG: lipase family protein [Ilumatobacteraceae bacterium]
MKSVDGGFRRRLTWVNRFTGYRAFWWVSVLVGVACVALGVWLLAAPFRSESTLHWLIAAGMLLSGVAEVASSSTARRPTLARVIGSSWVLVGIVVLVVTNLTLYGTAIVVGSAIVVGGLIRIGEAIAHRGADRPIQLVAGGTNVLLGGLAVTWPAVTLLVLAIVFGVRTIVVGLVTVWSGVSASGRRDDDTIEDGVPTAASVPSRWRLVGAIVTLALVAGATMISVAVNRVGPSEADAFYDQPDTLPDAPLGTIVRSEEIDTVTPGARTYRVMYVSTGFDGERRAVSGLIVVPTAPAPSGGRDMVVFTHGTTGVDPGCAPSLLDDPTRVMEALPELIAAGYVVAATDYQGLGTSTRHPYLVGQVEAMNALDSGRAARLLPDADATDRFAVWGHSQGGHASLFTGQLAASYAPELELVGVAAGGPVPDLVALFKFNLATPVGKILISMALKAWADVYDLDLDQVVTPSAREAVEEIAKICVTDVRQILARVPDAALLGLTFLRVPPWEVEPWASIVRDNTPGGAPTNVPMLLAQGGADIIVDPALTQRFADERCADGETVGVVVLPGVDHVSTGFEGADQVTAWISDRFDGLPAPSSCP